MPTINYATIIDDFIKDGFFSEYLPPVFSMRNRFDPCSISLSSSADLVPPMSFNMSRFSEDGKRRTIYIPEFSSYLATVKFMKEKDIIKISGYSQNIWPYLLEAKEISNCDIILNKYKKINYRDIII